MEKTGLTTKRNVVPQYVFLRMILDLFRTMTRPYPIYLLRLKTGQSFAVILFLQSTRQAKLFYKKQKRFDSKIHERHDYI